MAFKKTNMNELIRITTLVLFAVPLVASSNIDCNGKSFHCVNSTHFMICVDLGNGVSSTIDDFIIPCPSSTECQATNYFECEFPIITTIPPGIDSSVPSALGSSELTTVTTEPNIISTTPELTSEVLLTETNTVSVTSLPFESIINNSSTSYISESTTKVDFLTTTDTSLGNRNETTQGKDNTSETANITSTASDHTDVNIVSTLPPSMFYEYTTTGLIDTTDYTTVTYTEFLESVSSTEKSTETDNSNTKIDIVATNFTDLKNTNTADHSNYIDLSNTEVNSVSATSNNTISFNMTDSINLDYTTVKYTDAIESVDNSNYLDLSTTATEMKINADTNDITSTSLSDTTIAELTTMTNIDTTKGIISDYFTESFNTHYTTVSNTVTTESIDYSNHLDLSTTEEQISSKKKDVTSNNLNDSINAEYTTDTTERIIADNFQSGLSTTEIVSVTTATLVETTKADSTSVAYNNTPQDVPLDYTIPTHLLTTEVTTEENISSTKKYNTTANWTDSEIADYVTVRNIDTFESVTSIVDNTIVTDNVFPDNVNVTAMEDSSTAKEVAADLNVTESVEYSTGAYSTGAYSTITENVYTNSVSTASISTDKIITFNDDRTSAGEITENESQDEIHVEGTTYDTTESNGSTPAYYSTTEFSLPSKSNETINTILQASTAATSTYVTDQANNYSSQSTTTSQNGFINVDNSTEASFITVNSNANDSNTITATINKEIYQTTLRFESLTEEVLSHTENMFNIEDPTTESALQVNYVVPTITTLEKISEGTSLNGTKTVRLSSEKNMMNIHSLSTEEEPKTMSNIPLTISHATTEVITDPKYKIKSRATFETTTNQGPHLSDLEKTSIKTDFVAASVQDATNNEMQTTTYITDKTAEGHLPSTIGAKNIHNIFETTTQSLEAVPRMTSSGTIISRSVSHDKSISNIDIVTSTTASIAHIENVPFITSTTPSSSIIFSNDVKIESTDEILTSILTTESVPRKEISDKSIVTEMDPKSIIQRSNEILSSPSSTLMVTTLSPETGNILTDSTATEATITSTAKFKTDSSLTNNLLDVTTTQTPFKSKYKNQTSSVSTFDTSSISSNNSNILAVTTTQTPFERKYEHKTSSTVSTLNTISISSNNSNIKEFITSSQTNELTTESNQQAIHNQANKLNETTYTTETNKMSQTTFKRDFTNKNEDQIIITRNKAVENTDVPVDASAPTIVISKTSAIYTQQGVPSENQKTSTTVYSYVSDNERTVTEPNKITSENILSPLVRTTTNSYIIRPSTATPTQYSEILKVQEETLTGTQRATSGKTDVSGTNLKDIKKTENVIAVTKPEYIATYKRKSDDEKDPIIMSSKMTLLDEKLKEDLHEERKKSSTTPRTLYQNNQNQNPKIGSSDMLPKLENGDNPLHLYCHSRIRGRYSDPNDCTKFYICIGKYEPIVGKCPANTVFSDFKKQCTQNKSHCVRQNQFKCLSEGRYSDLLKSNVYYICVKRAHIFIRFQFQCQNGYYLDKTTVRCSKEELTHQSISVDKNSDTGSSESKPSNEIKPHKTEKKHDTENDEEFECSKEGKFADTKTCRKYYVCTKNKKSEFRMRRKSCDSDEVFHKDKKKCVDADSYEC